MRKIRGILEVDAVFSQTWRFCMILQRILQELLTDHSVTYMIYVVVFSKVCNLDTGLGTHVSASVIYIVNTMPLACTW